MKAKHIIVLVILPVIAISLSIAAYGYNQVAIRNNYADQHATALHPVAPICGNHVCKPGEVYNATAVLNSTVVSKP